MIKYFYNGKQITLAQFNDWLVKLDKIRSESNKRIYSIVSPSPDIIGIWH